MSPRDGAAGRSADTGRAAAPASRTIVRHATTFAALGDRTRLHLVAVLCAGGTVSITDLTAGTELTRQAVTKHLEVLADAGLVRDLRVGRERRWQLEAARLAEARRALEAYGARWDRALGRLKASLEA
ncbi:MAG: metalloregulator ArsR/SmtB family transcription factor [Pseudomonadota bacterium]|nr:metalloregulator ArsR/SmtB family transcription factor [Pseudomonadota bacterium]